MSSDTPDSTPPLSTAERRVALAKQLVDVHRHYTLTERQTLAAQFGCSAATIYRDLQALRAAAAPPPPVPIRLTPATPQMAERDLLLLRTLGHLKLLRGDWVADLIYPDRAIATVNRRLTELVNQGLIWRTQQHVAPELVPQADGRLRPMPPPQRPRVYGLTPAGAELLRQTGESHSEFLIAHVHTRSPRSAPPPVKTLQRDLLIASWCASLLSAVRRCLRLSAAFAQLEPPLARRKSTDAQGNPDHTVVFRSDAFVLLQFSKEPQESGPFLPLPWYRGHIIGAGGLNGLTPTYTLAVDEDWTDHDVQQLATMYRRVVTDTLSAIPRGCIPVLLTTSRDRVELISRVWNAVWADSPALVTTVNHAEHPEWGVILGSYARISDVQPNQKVPARTLIHPLFPTVDAWEQACGRGPQRQG